MDKKSTTSLLDILQKTKDVQQLKDYKNEFLTKNKIGFADYMNHMLIEKNLEKSKLIQDSGISRTYGYQLLQGRKKPSRNKVLSLCLAAKLNLKETQRALSYAEEGTLYAKNQRDAVIIFSIENNYDLIATNELLYDMKEELLTNEL